LVYAQLGSPEVEFDSFWHVYNLLRDALDSEYLFQSSVGVFDEENTSRDSDIDQLPLHHLRGYEFGDILSCRYTRLRTAFGVTAGSGGSVRLVSC
jgi:hypothetical protein